VKRGGSKRGGMEKEEGMGGRGMGMVKEGSREGEMC
jgi:hypothetical protein